ncbi:MAG: undecaprenyl-diphosphate phosphatase [Acidobacteria bacterium]|nr:undecaprenyl-diphosphate phosphatase [Acidobacteriota bacterium]MBU4306862.1 undecaprenyl-diphosphate phosphatase [Acidobacteriota bacterium]MCG2810192.1 undecaprenyl-diphosphate phosphatase [Candidatus Aminicenantes bacterium]
MPLILKVVLLAIVQGFTEFFPISSSGHLVVLQKILNFTTLPLVYDLFLHLGTLLAVVIYFFKDLQPLVLRCYEKENFRMLLLLATASLPTAIIGFAFKDFFEALFEKTFYLGFCFIFTAAVLLASRYFRLKKVPIFPAAFLIGIAQGIAIIPGISRSGITIAVALILGLGFEFSFRFSFLLSIPAILGAVLLEYDKIPWQGGHWPQLLLAVLVSALAGFLALGLLKKIMIKEKFHRFAIYLLVLAALVFLFL